jgi:hypothetical protein
MLTIKDLSTSKELDRAAMGTVRGGNVPNVLKVINKPEIDLSSDFVTQKQLSFADQSGNLGGLNFVFNNQYQEGDA